MQTSKNNALVLTDGQRRAALEKSKCVRSERAELKKRMKAGEIPAEDAIAHPLAARMTVIQFARALPGIGIRRAEAVLADAGIDPRRRIGSLGCRQVERLLDKFGR